MADELAISFDLTGTAAVVTGAAQGIGQAVAVALAGQGADVACVDLDAERQADTVARVEAHGRRALALGCDVAVVMAGDGQMDPEDLPALLDPIADGAADYVKGNRFLHPAIWTAMPASRIVGNAALSIATRVTSGYRHVFDSQCGYTAIHRRALAAIELDKLFPRYGYPNDLLSRLRVADMRVVDVPVRPIYGPAWRSGIGLGTALHPMPWVLLRSWTTRLAAQMLRRAPA